MSASASAAGDGSLIYGCSHGSGGDSLMRSLGRTGAFDRPDLTRCLGREGRRELASESELKGDVSLSGGGNYNRLPERRWEHSPSPGATSLHLTGGGRQLPDGTWKTPSRTVRLIPFQAWRGNNCDREEHRRMLGSQLLRRKYPSPLGQMAGGILRVPDRTNIR